jgi:hypothetical protein
MIKSRLKKIAEFVDGIMLNEKDMLEIYKNPTSEEFRSMLKKSKWNSIRMFEKQDGTVYAWDSDVLHNDMASKKPSMVGPVHLEIFEDGELNIYLEQSIKNASMLKTYLDKLPLYNYGAGEASIIDINTSYYVAPRDPIYDQISTLGDFNKLVNDSQV